MTEIDFDAVLEQLAIASERTEAEIKGEIEALMDTHDYHLAGAIAVWKSEHQNEFAGEKLPYTARVICFEPSRTANTSGGSTAVANVHFAWNNPETGEVEFKAGTLWGKERIDEFSEIFEVGKVYTFEAATNQKGNLTRMATAKTRDEDGKIIEDLGYIEEPDDEAPTVDEIDPMPINSLVNRLGEYDMVRGWVGDTINKQGTKDAMGFQLGDITSLAPARVWFAGKYTKMTPEAIQAVKDDLTKTAEVIVYGYINQRGTDVSINASAIWFV